jgi:hypothetical protein
MLTDMFGLTPTEASVAIGIVGGKQLAEIAADRVVKTGTVRGSFEDGIRQDADSGPGGIGSARDPRILVDPAARPEETRASRWQVRADLCCACRNRRKKISGSGQKRKFASYPYGGCGMVRRGNMKAVELKVAKMLGRHRSPTDAQWRQYAVRWSASARRA